MANATVNDLGELHGIIARTLKDQITNGVIVETKDGTAQTISAPASLINVARQFLRDNNIECDGSNNEDIKGLVEDLPFETQETVRPN